MDSLTEPVQRLRALEDAILALDRVGEAVACTMCDRTKNPRGRDSGMMGVYGCDRDCPGYDREPRATELHPGERASDFGYSYLDFDGSKKLWEIIRRIRERRESDE